MFGSRLCQMWQKFSLCIGKEKYKVPATADLLFWNCNNTRFKTWPKIFRVHRLGACHVHIVHLILIKLCKYIALTYWDDQTKFQNQRSFRFKIAKIQSSAKISPKNAQLDDVIKWSWRHTRKFFSSLLHAPNDYLQDLGSLIALSQKL